MRRALAWAAANPVFANLLMLFLVAAGGFTLLRMRREMFPEFSFDTVTVAIAYPGAAPAEVERSVTIKVEEAVRGVDGVHEVTSVSTEGSSRVTIEVDPAVRDPRDALVDIRNEVSRITTFPGEVKEPVVTLALNRQEAITLALSGDVDEDSLTRQARQLEDELLLLPEVNDVTVSGLRPYEISVEVRERDLQRYGLQIEQVTAAIRAASLDLPLGRLRSPDEEQLLRVAQERRTGRELADVPVLSRPDGTRVLLREVARTSDGYSEDERPVRLDGLPAVTFTVRRSGDQDLVQLARVVAAWSERRAATLPAPFRLEVWKDDSLGIVDRLELLSRNGVQGLWLVLAVLCLFLGLRLSFWVALGLPVAFLTAMLLLDQVGGTLNMISSFALIMIMGILVDDSIVVGENIGRHMREGGWTVRSAIAGLEEVAWPVIASVTTTVVAFLPLMAIEGRMGKFIHIMPVAVVACLVASLIECLLILPAHLAHQRPPRRRETTLERLRARFDRGFDRFIDRGYGRTVDWSIRNRYVVLALSLAFLIVIGALAASGRPAFIFFPRLDAEQLQARIVMPQGTPLAGTRALAARVEAAAARLRQELPLAEDGAPIVRRVLTRAGDEGAHVATVQVELSRSSLRTLKSIAIQQRWKELVGPAPEASSLTFGGGGHGPGGNPIEVRVLVDDPAQGQAASSALQAALATYPGVFNVDDNLDPGKRELRFALRPEAWGLGVSLAAMARQLQWGFTGQEVMKLQRGRDEVEVRVRYDATARQREDQLAGVRLRAGGQDRLLPLTWAARVERGRSLSKIERRDGRRVVLVTADVDDALTNANQVVQSLREDALAGLQARYPGALFQFGGQQEQQRETLVSLGAGFLLAMFGIYVILALLFGSYVQPLIVMGAIPVGLAGAVLGHALFGRPLMIFSVFGMVGLTGIVVNDALVMIDFINRHRSEGHDALESVSKAGRVRFRAVFLTTVTTVAGLMPILLERSLQAQFVIPMAISIACGVALATLLTLYVVPCAYLALDDLRRFYVRQQPLGAAAPASATVGAAD